jgi:hypothetical protein
MKMSLIMTEIRDHQVLVPSYVRLERLCEFRDHLAPTLTHYVTRSTYVATVRVQVFRASSRRLDLRT